MTLFIYVKKGELNKYTFRGLAGTTLKKDISNCFYEYMAINI